MTRARARVGALLLGIAVVAGACGGSSAKESGSPQSTASQNPEADTLTTTVASFDLAVGPARRFLTGLTFGDGRLVGFGTIKVSVHPEAEKPDAYETASYLPALGEEIPSPVPDQPTVIKAGHGRGAYRSQVTLDKVGIWTVDVEADVEGYGPLRASTQFQVTKDHSAVQVGERAPASKNPTMAAHGTLPLAAIDSRAGKTKPVPDPELHDVRIADAVAAKRPMVIVVSTPVYCQSRFCGPITDTVADLQQTYGKQAEFIHVEVWGNFAKQQLNAAAADYIARGKTEGGEPWVFVVGSDGIVKARFDNLATREELEQAIKQYAK